MLGEIGTLAWTRRTNGLLSRTERARYIAAALREQALQGPRLFGALERVKHDAEVLFVATMLHDQGVLEPTGRCFTLRGADEAEQISGAAVTRGSASRRRVDRYSVRRPARSPPAARPRCSRPVSAWR